MTDPTTPADSVKLPVTQYKPDVVIYHDHCADGFAGAWACWMRWGDACQYVPASYGQPAPDVTGKDVLLVDFSYKRDALREMGHAARSVIVLDHHKTAEADLAEWAIDDIAGDFWAGDDPLKLVRCNDEHVGQPIAALFDMNKSGARLAWEFCHDAPVPLLIELVEDRDLWRFRLDNTKPFSLWLRSEPFSFDRFELLSQELNDVRDSDRIMAEARAMQRFFDAKVDEITSFARRAPLGGFEPITVNCPPMFSSEVGHALLDKHPGAPFAAMYYDAPNGRMWSLRSRDDREDVSAIAAAFGGGGHRNAAGFKADLPRLSAESAHAEGWPSREAVAQVVNPRPFASWQSMYDYCLSQGDDDETARRYADGTHKADCDKTLATADAILALFRSPPASATPETTTPEVWRRHYDAMGQAAGRLKAAIRPQLDAMKYADHAEVRRAFNDIAIVAGKALDTVQGRSPPASDGMVRAIGAAQFLSDRLDDLEWMEGDLESTLRDFMGHVDPAHSRLKSVLAELAATSEESSNAR